jgi:hypothetical protein
MKETYGKVNAYILNKMRYYENQAMNEYDLVHKINKRFHHKLRANEVFKLHIKPLIARHWLIEIKNNGEISYIRIGEIRHVRAEETLKDQFYGYPEDMWDYMAGYYSQDEVIREMWESDPVNFMTEKEALEYWSGEYEEYLKHQES